MNLLELNRATLARQALLERAPAATTPAAMVERLLGLQAQEPKPPFIGLWSRIEGFRADDLRAALLSGDVVRATLMRATLHLMSGADYAAFRPALQPALDAAMASILKARGEGIEPGEVTAAARKLLARGRRLTFDEIREALSAEFPDADDRALGYVTRTGVPLQMAATDDRWGYPRDAQFRLVTKTDPDSDPREMVRRYLAAFGPATPADFQVWSGLKGARALFKEIENEFEMIEGPDGKPLYDVPDGPRPGDDAAAPVRFLPAFDNLVLSHEDRSRVIADADRPKLLGTGNLRVRPTFLVDGRVAGMWAIKATKKKATLTIEPFGKLAKRLQGELIGEGEALLRFAEPDVAALDVRFAA